MMDWKGCGRNWPCSNFRYYPGVDLDGVSKFIGTSVRFGTLSIVRYSTNQKTQEFLKLDLFPSSGLPLHPKTETDPVSGTMCFIVSRIPDDG
jgi:hypothetical protein